MAKDILLTEWNYQNQEKIRTLRENETYKYFGIFEADTLKEVEMKDKVQKEYLKRTKKLLETKFSRRNLIKRINIWAIPLVRYSRPFLKWTREDIKQMGQRTRKLITIHQVFHPSDDVYRLYVSGNKRGRGLASIEGSFDASKQRLEDSLKTVEEE